MERLVGMIMVLILVTHDLVEASNHIYNNNNIDDDDEAVVPSMPPPPFSSVTATYDIRLRIPEFLRNKASGILRALKENGVRCADPMSIMICHQMFSNYQLFAACVTVSVAWCLRRRVTDHGYECTLGCAHSMNTHNTKFDTDTKDGYLGICYNNCNTKF